MNVYRVPTKVAFDLLQLTRNPLLASRWTENGTNHPDLLSL